LNYACLSNAKNEKECSKKDCVCGGHNANNPKSNLKHNSTLKKINIRKQRRLVENTKKI
jgi:hypothetical protein